MRLHVLCVGYGLNTCWKVIKKCQKHKTQRGTRMFCILRATGLQVLTHIYIYYIYTLMIQPWCDMCTSTYTHIPMFCLCFWRWPFWLLSVCFLNSFRPICWTMLREKNSLDIPFQPFQLEHQINPSKRPSQPTRCLTRFSVRFGKVLGAGVSRVFWRVFGGILEGF